MCLLSFFFGYFVRTPLGWQHFDFVCARETKKRVKYWPDHFLCATYNTWTDFLGHHVWAIYIYGCFHRYWISLHIDESTSEVDFFVIVHVYRGLFLVPPKSTRIISSFILSFSATNPMRHLPHEGEFCRDCFGAEECWGSGITHHIRACSSERIHLISLKQRTWSSAEFNSVFIYTCINPRKYVKMEFK